VLFSYVIQLILAPKGVADSIASLKHCLPKGIPMMVMHHKIPATMKDIARAIPQIKSHITFAMGCLPKFVVTVEPKGHADKRAILKHCFPNGIPMIVMHRIRPSKNQESAAARPVKINQRMLPINFIAEVLLFHLICFDFIINRRICQVFRIFKILPRVR
jgi:hypothetical protein